MIQRVLSNKETGKRLVMFEESDFERENPIKHYGDEIIVKQMILNGVPWEEMSGEKTLSERSTAIFKNAYAYWIEMKKGFQEIKVPGNLIRLLTSSSKKDQQILLKGLVLSPEILTSFFFTAYHEFGFTLSQYTSECNSKMSDTQKIPSPYSTETTRGTAVIGKTPVSGAQLKNTLEHQRVIVARIVDKGIQWHCFFTVVDHFGREETWLDKKPSRFCYISNAFGMDRAEVVQQLKTGQDVLAKLPYIMAGARDSYVP